MYFSHEQIALARQSFAEAEIMTRRFFGINAGEQELHRYDVKTRAFLEKHEICDGTFAHLFKYELNKEREREHDRNGDEVIVFYRICLQDDVILDAVKRADSFVRLSPLLLYVATHELVHVIRFERGAGDFYATGDEKTSEEEKVHRITRNLLKPLADAEMNLVLDCFSDRYRMQPFQ
ncbi:MAG: hypothetical protein ACYDH8_06255 [Syntrophales bacterium]